MPNTLSLGLSCAFCDEIKEPLAEIGVGHQDYICKKCMERRPQKKESIAFLRALFGYGFVNIHSNYMMEKIEIAFNAGSLDYLIGSLDLMNQQKFMRELGL